MTSDQPAPTEPPPSPVPIEKLFERFYQELRAVARHYMLGERPNHTLQATELVNQAFLRLASSGVVIEDRAHFLRLAARTMRRILIDHARPPRPVFVTLGDDSGVVLSNIDAIDLYRLIDKLEQLSERQALILELRYAMGLTVEEVAKELRVSPETVKRDTRIALAWLRRELGR